MQSRNGSYLKERAPFLTVESTISDHVPFPSPNTLSVSWKRRRMDFIFKNAQKATVLIWLSSLLNTLPAGTLVERMKEEETGLKGGWHQPTSCSSPVSRWLWKPQGPRQPGEPHLFEWYCPLHLLLAVSYLRPFREGRGETMT